MPLEVARHRHIPHRNPKRLDGEFLAEALIKVSDGWLDLPVSDTVPRVVGRPAYSVSDFARDYAANRRP